MWRPALGLPMLYLGTCVLGYCVRGPSNATAEASCIACPKQVMQPWGRPMCMGPCMPATPSCQRGSEQCCKAMHSSTPLCHCCVWRPPQCIFHAPPWMPISTVGRFLRQILLSSFSFAACGNFAHGTDEKEERQLGKFQPVLHMQEPGPWCLGLNAHGLSMQHAPHQFTCFHLFQPGYASPNILLTWHDAACFVGRIHRTMLRYSMLSRTQVETIMISIISMLSSPNDESPANIDAAKEWREDRETFKKKVARIVRKSQEML